MTENWEKIKMQAYDFQTTVNRDHMGSLKMLMTPDILKEKGLVSFAAGEMDFPTAPSLSREVKKVAENGLYGFTLKDSWYLDHVCWWMKQARGWEIDPSWVVTTYGTIFSVAIAIRTFVGEGQRMIVQPPFYSRYKQAADRLGRETVYNPLKQEGGRYTFDLENLEACMADPRNTLLILCNPLNPSGTVFTREELTEVARLSAKYGTVVLSDEIFAEILLEGEPVTPYASIPEGRAYGITCTSLGKTFNCTGVNHANVIIPHEGLRERFEKQRTRDHYGSIDPCAYAATIGAYSPEGWDWVLAMRQTIKKNSDYVHDIFRKNMPQFPIMDTQGSFVCWIDFRSLGLEGENLEKELLERALYHIDPGTDYGPYHGGFARMNLGSTYEQTTAAMERLSQVYGIHSV
jgi:cystathionine beta-lyase